MYCDDVLTNAIAAKNRQLEEENARLKDLNREMVGMLKELLYEEQYGTTHKAVNLLAKAEGKGKGTEAIHNIKQKGTR